MTGDVQHTLEGLRRAVGARNEAELARKLGINQSTVSSWKQRGRVPARFSQMIDDPKRGPLPDPKTISGELQERAYPIGVIRFTLLRADLIQSGDAENAMPILRDMQPFWFVLLRATHDLLTRVETSRVDLATAQALVMQEDLRVPGETRERVERALAEDLTDWRAKSERPGV